MSNIVVNSADPVEIILRNSIFEEKFLATEFKTALQDMWQHKLLRMILDFAATKCKSGTLVFKISNQRFFEMDEGNCKTITSSVDKFLNVFKSEKRFEISIKKLKTEIVIHEIMHMVEKALDIKLQEDFVPLLVNEMRYKSAAPNFDKAVEQILVLELQGYPKNHIASELFVRIYQLFAMSKEIKGYSDEFAFSCQAIERTFPRTLTWLDKNVHGLILGATDSAIKSASARYEKSFEEMQENTVWSKSRVKSFHKKEDGVSKKWSKTIKSIDENDFDV